MAANTSPGGGGGQSSAVGNPALFIAIELNGMNGYTGKMAVTGTGRSGGLFFRAGRLVHAETGNEVGEDAFRRIMGWPGTEYVLQPDAAPLKDTISRGLDELLAELRGQPAPKAARAPEPSAGARRPGLAGIAEQVRRIPGVVGAVLHTPDGGPIGGEALSPADDMALGLTRLGKKLGDLLKAGPLVLGVVHGTRRNLLLLTSRDQQLTILIEAGNQAEAAQAQIRKLLSAQA